jgi:metallophosphoesterase superfamily enzyme
MLQEQYGEYSKTGFSDTASPRILLGGRSFLPDKTGALFWPSENTLIVADPFLSRPCYLTGEDVALPPYDTATAYEKLEEVIDRHDPGRVIVLGSCFGSGDENCLTRTQRDWLLDMMDGRDWYWVPHQSEMAVARALGGTAVPHVVLGGIKFRAAPLPASVNHEIAGGMHPIATLERYGHAMRGRCFVSNSMRLVLPSIGNYSLGSNVLSEALHPLLGSNGMFVWMLHEERVEFIAPALLTNAFLG